MLIGIIQGKFKCLTIHLKRHVMHLIIVILSGQKGHLCIFLYFDNFIFVQTKLKE